MSEIEVSIVIPTYNRRDYLKDALESFSGQTYEHIKFEVIVVDDFSTDKTKEMVMEVSRRVDFCIRYYRNERKGQTVARNIGFRMAKGEIVVSTDSDIKATPEWLKNGLRYFSDGEIYGVEGRIIMEGEIIPFIHGLSNEKGGTYQTANMFYRRDVLERTGYLDENLNRWWNFGSDYDLAIRIMREGGRIVFAPDAIVYHPVYRLKTRDMLKNSLKSGAIPYLYKKHVDLPYHLKMSYRRTASAVFTMGFWVSVCFLNYIGMVISITGLIYFTIGLIPRFWEANPLVKIKAILVYSLSAVINFTAFLYGCMSLHVIPCKKIFRL